MQRVMFNAGVRKVVCKFPTRSIVVNAASNPIATNARPVYTAKDAMQKVRI